MVRVLNKEVSGCIVVVIQSTLDGPEDEFPAACDSRVATCSQRMMIMLQAMLATLASFTNNLLCENKSKGR